MKEKKNNPKLLAVSYNARDRERNDSPGVLHTDTFVMFQSTGKYERV